MRRFVRFLLLPLLVLAIGWLAVWWYAQGRLEMAVEQGTHALRAAGWKVSRGPITRGTSPLRAGITVTDLKLTPPQANGPAPTLDLPTLNLLVRPGAPLTLEIGLPTAWRMAIPQGPDFTIHFGSIEARDRFDLNALIAHDPDPIRSGFFRATDMRVDSANTNFTLISIAELAASGTRDPHAGKDGTAFSVHERLAGLALSPIFATLGNLPFDGKLTELGLDLSLSGPAVDLPANLTPPSQIDNPFVPSVADGEAMWQAIGPAVHRWAGGGGHGTFGFTLKVGPLNARDTGTFGFDAKVQPKVGTHLVADGLGAALGTIASHYPALVDSISALTTTAAPYMTKGPGPGDGQRLAIDLELSGGKLTANGKPVIDVPPLTWPKPSTQSD